MQAVILAAGASGRFYPFRNFGHKALVKIMGKTLLEHTLLSIKKAGITEVIIVIGKNNYFQSVIGSGKALGIHITYLVQPEPLGMGDALLQAEKAITGDFFLLNAYHVEFDQVGGDMIRTKREKGEVVLLGKEHEGVDRYGYFRVSGEKVMVIKEKPNDTSAQESGLRIIGIYLLTKQFLSLLKETPPNHYHFEDALNTFAQKGKVRFHKTEKETITLKYAWDLLDVKDYLLKNLSAFTSPFTTISKHAIIQGVVHIEKGAKIFEGVCLKGPCYIGENAVVGNNALLRGGTCIEANSVAGSYMEMTNTLLMEHATTHSGFIGDSVIGMNCKIGASICTANVRLDRGKVQSLVKEKRVESFRKHLGVIIGDNVILGAGVTTMPGLIIGNDTLVGPSTTVMQNIEDSVLYYAEFKNIVKKRIPS